MPILEKLFHVFVKSSTASSNVCALFTENRQYKIRLGARLLLWNVAPGADLSTQDLGVAKGKRQARQTRHDSPTRIR
jgi:hypothetical protein